MLWVCVQLISRWCHRVGINNKIRDIQNRFYRIDLSCLDNSLLFVYLNKDSRHTMEILFIASIRCAVVKYIIYLHSDGYPAHAWKMFCSPEAGAAAALNWPLRRRRSQRENMTKKMLWKSTILWGPGNFGCERAAVKLFAGLLPHQLFYSPSLRLLTKLMPDLTTWSRFIMRGLRPAAAAAFSFPAFELILPRDDTEDSRDLSWEKMGKKKNNECATTFLGKQAI